MRLTAQTGVSAKDGVRPCLHELDSEGWGAECWGFLLCWFITRCKFLAAFGAFPKSQSQAKSGIILSPLEVTAASKASALHRHARSEAPAPSVLGRRTWECCSKLILNTWEGDCGQPHFYFSLFCPPSLHIAGISLHHSPPSSLPSSVLPTFFLFFFFTIEW